MLAAAAVLSRNYLLMNCIENVARYELIKRIENGIQFCSKWNDIFQPRKSTRFGPKHFVDTVINYTILFRRFFFCQMNSVYFDFILCSRRTKTTLIFIQLEKILYWNVSHIGFVCENGNWVASVCDISLPTWRTPIDNTNSYFRSLNANSVLSLIVFTMRSMTAESE